MMPLMCLFAALLASSLAAPYNPHARVRVSFASPPHSYSHGHDLMPDASEYHHQPSPGATHDDSLLQLYPYLPSARLQSVDPTISPDILDGPELEALIARFANNEPRFFDQFPHQRSLLSNIDLRISQNLPALKTGSIRPGSPFYRL